MACPSKPSCCRRHEMSAHPTLRKLRRPSAPGRCSLAQTPPAVLQRLVVFPLGSSAKSDRSRAEGDDVKQSNFAAGSYFEKLLPALSGVSTESDSDRVPILRAARNREDENPVATALGTDLIPQERQVR